MAKKLNILDMQPKIVMEPISKDSHYIRCRILIVCEGEKTEPNYFKSFSMMKNSSGLVYEVHCDGGRINTLQVVDKAIELKNKAIEKGNPYDDVWAVFDRDSFSSSDFDNAINKAYNNEIKCAWSNEAFELWYVYHFDARCTAMNRKDYEKVLNKRIKDAGYKNGKKAFTYKKNDPNIRNVLSKCNCDEKKAITYAENQASNFHDNKFHNHNPCTMVYKLVRLLIGEDKDFIKEIEKKLSD